MPNQLTSTGLQTATREELITTYTTGMQAIYGTDINLSTDSPDGQQMNLVVQMNLDTLDLVREVYNSFDPDQAIGTTLDKRCSINNVQRSGGTYSIAPITIVTSRTVNLDGYSTVGVEEAYTIEDDTGTQWILIDSYTGIGTFVLQFRAKEIGEQNASIGTIVNQTTIVLGVDSVNNASALVVLGSNEETDYQLKIKRQKSVARSSSGYLSSLYAELYAVNGVTDVKIIENRTNAIDSNGSPAHSIWVIVEGTFLNADIATAIYKKRNGGCNMRGLVSYIVTQVDGNTIEINWDIVELEDLYIEFSVSSLDGVNPPLSALIKAELPNVFVPETGQQLNINDLVEAVKSIDSNSLVTAEGLGLNGIDYYNVLAPTSKKNRFLVSSANITIAVV